MQLMSDYTSSNPIRQLLPHIIVMYRYFIQSTPISECQFKTYVYICDSSDDANVTAAESNKPLIV